MPQLRKPSLLFDQAGVGGRFDPKPSHQVDGRNHRANSLGSTSADFLPAQGLHLFLGIQPRVDASALLGCRGCRHGCNVAPAARDAKCRLALLEFALVHHSVPPPVRQAYSTSMRGMTVELLTNPASAAWSRKAAQRAGFVSNSTAVRLGRSCFGSQTAGPGTPRPATAIDCYTLDVCPETAGRDESVTQLNESADASKFNGLTISPSPAGTPPCPARQ